MLPCADYCLPPVYTKTSVSLIIIPVETVASYTEQKSVHTEIFRVSPSEMI